MDTKTLLILAGVGGVAYYLYTESEKKKLPKPVELSQKSKDMAVAKAAIAAGTYKGSARYQRRQAQQAAARAKKAATFTPSAAPPPTPAPTPASEVREPLVPCPEGFYPHQGGCMRESISGQSPEEIQAGNDALAAWREREGEATLALLTEAVGRGDLRAVKDAVQQMNPFAPEKTYEEWLAQTAQGADATEMAAMVTLACTQDPTGANTQIGPNSQGCRFYTTLAQVAQMAKAEVAKKNSGLALAAIGLPVLGLFLVMPLAVVPWVVKQFKPEWSYGKRVATGFVVSFGLGAVTKIAKAASGEDEPKEAAAVT
jgi:hypothetical protein